MVMTPTPTLEFWFEFASPYSYVAVEEIETKCATADIPLVWRVFLLGPIFAAQGWRDSPFNLYPAKGAYMWRDMERLCIQKGLAWRKPTQFPRSGLLAARVAAALEGTPALGCFAKAVFRANFTQDLDISDAGVIAGLLRDLGLDDKETLRRAGDDDVKTALRRRTDEAAAQGIFGAPTFVAQGRIVLGRRPPGSSH
jgi:2-hydroxychromene-2-carboxylate isomerase